MDQVITFDNRRLNMIAIIAVLMLLFTVGVVVYWIFG